MPITLTSPSFSAGAKIPKKHAGDGDNLSPELAWSKSRMAVESYAVIMEDPDAPSGTFIHWVIFNIPAEASRLPEGVPVKAGIPGIGRQGVNDARTNGYYGPCPPPGKPHRYFFKIFALDKVLDLRSGCTASQLQFAMQSHLLDSGELMGSYHR
jgi:Raf kinase inhibitor-like YbhB/YbcL family protein